MSKRLGMVSIGFVVAFAAVVALTAGLVARQQAAPAAASSPDALMGAAQYLEEVQGKPDAAIAAYKKVLAAPGVSRALAARAQFRIGACYEKLGQADARRAYDAVVRDFADQPDLVRQAQARLTALAGGTQPVGDGPIVRRLFSGTGSDDPIGGVVSPDGRLIAFERRVGAEWELAVRELATAEIRTLPKGSCTGPYGLSWSGDSRHLSFQCTPANDRAVTELRITDLAGSSPRLVYSTKDSVDDAALSPDGATTYALMSDDAISGRLVAISNGDGTVRTLWARSDRATGTAIRVSPDGRFVAFEISKADRRRDWAVWVVPAAGGEALPATTTISSEQVVDWTPDGTGVVVAAANGESPELNLVAFRDGRVGPRTRLRIDLPGLRTYAARITKFGVLVATAGRTEKGLLLARIDSAAGRLAESHAPVPVDGPGGVYPAWSPDGGALAYFAGDSAGAQSQLVIYSAGSQQVRMLRVPGTAIGSLRWSSDGRTLTYALNTAGSVSKLFRTDVPTVKTTELPNSAGLWDANVTSDGKLAFGSAKGGAMVRDLVTGSERPILEGITGTRALSPDERWLAVNEREPTKGLTGVKLIPSEGGAAKELFRCRPGSFLYTYVNWSSDSRRVFVVEYTSGSDRTQPMRLWSIPIDGQSPVRTELGDIHPSGGFSVHPDGRTVALTNMRSEPREVWAVENFLPAAKPAPKAGAIK